MAGRCTPQRTRAVPRETLSVSFRTRISPPDGKTTASQSRGQVGIGTLILFIVAVIIAAATVGVLFDVAGVLQGQTASTSDQSSAQLTDRIDVVAVTGNSITQTEPYTVGEVNVIITQAGGSGDVDLTNITAQWYGPNDSYNLLSDRAGDSGDETFTTEALDDPEGTFPVLTSSQQRFVLRFEPGTEFGSSGLTEGDRVSIQLTAESRSSKTVRFTVPQSLSGRSSVTL